MEIAWFLFFQSELRSKLKTAAVILKKLVKVFSLICPFSSVLFTTVWSSIPNTFAKRSAHFFDTSVFFVWFLQATALFKANARCCSAPIFPDTIAQWLLAELEAELETFAQMSQHILERQHTKTEGCLIFWSCVLANPRYAIIRPKTAVHSAVL